MAEGRRRVHERFGVELEPEVQILGEVELARATGSCEAAAGRRIAVVRGRGRGGARTSSSVRRQTVAPTGASVPRAGGDDRQRRGRGRGQPPTARSLALAARCPRTGRCPQLPLDGAAEGRPARGPGAAAGAGPRRGPGRRCGPTRRQLLRRKRGRRRTHARGSNCASATPRRPDKWKAAAAVLADPTLDRPRLCRPALARPAGDGRLCRAAAAGSAAPIDASVPKPACA